MEVRTPDPVDRVVSVTVVVTSDESWVSNRDGDDGGSGYGVGGRFGW